MHEEVGLDFEASGPNRHADLDRQGGRLTILRILRDADGLVNGHRPFNALRPDLADYDQRDIYEIKPKHLLGKGLLEVWGYQAILNTARGQTHHWNLGSDYIPPGVVALTSREIAIVHPPINGVITYEVVNWTNNSNYFDASSAVTTAAMLTALIALAALVARYGWA